MSGKEFVGVIFEQGIIRQSPVLPLSTIKPSDAHRLFEEDRINKAILPVLFKWRDFIQPLHFLTLMHIKGKGDNMSNKFILMLILLVTTVFIAGCLDKDNGTTPPAKPELIPTTGLPEGITFMGSHETSLEIAGSLINATEGVYRNKGEDFYIQVIGNNDPDDLIARYKSMYKNARYDPFQEIYLNGHKAIQITDYSTINGKQQPNYAVIWATGKTAIIVSSPTADIQSVIALASATKS